MKKKKTVQLGSHNEREFEVENQLGLGSSLVSIYLSASLGDVTLLTRSLL